MSLPNSRTYYTAIYLVTILKTAQEVTSIATFSQTLLAFVAGLGVPFRAPKSNEVYEWHAWCCLCCSRSRTKYNAICRKRAVNSPTQLNWTVLQAAGETGALF